MRDVAQLLYQALMNAEVRQALASGRQPEDLHLAPHQIEAIGAVLRGFKGSSRGLLNQVFEDDWHPHFTLVDEG